MRVLTYVLVLCFVIACGDDDEVRLDASVDAVFDAVVDVRVDILVPDASQDVAVDAACIPVSCAAECETQVVDGCEECLCPAPECDSDADCALGTLVGTCCPNCTEAYSQTELMETACIAESFKPEPQCTPAGDCSAVVCPDIACERAVAAVCEAGQCQPTSTCPVGQVMGPDGCVPQCTSDTDCVVRIDHTDCCRQCTVVHQDEALNFECLIEEGSMNPPACQTEKDCSLVRCAGNPCGGVVPTCNPAGVCQPRPRG